MGARCLRSPTVRIPMMLMAALGDGYIVWDKAASIRYRKPGFSTLHADFVLSDEEVAEIRAELAK